MTTAVLPIRLLLIFVAAFHTQAIAQQPPGPPTVSVAQPVFKKVTEWDEFTGRFVAKEKVDVRARVSGY